MPNVTQNAPTYLRGTAAASGRAATWNRRMLTVATVVILWAASMLALQAAGPNARAMMAAEGMLINPTE